MRKEETKMQKKALLLVSFALAAVLVVGQVGFAAEPDNSKGMGNMMNGNGMSEMMDNGSMNKMMDAMNSPEGQAMMDSCGSFMESYDDGDISKSEKSA
jgi:hypothetical protein